MIVVETSALVEVLLRTPSATRIEARLFAPGETLHVPHLIDVECAQVMRRLAANENIGADRGHRALIDLADMPLRRYPHDILLPRVWELRHNLTAYDAVFVALAEILGATLITGDRRIATAAGHRAVAEVI